MITFITDACYVYYWWLLLTFITFYFSTALSFHDFIIIIAPMIVIVAEIIILIIHNIILLSAYRLEVSNHRGEKSDFHRKIHCEQPLHAGQAPHRRDSHVALSILSNECHVHTMNKEVVVMY